MDVSGLSGANIIQMQNQIQRQESKLEGFQAALESAMSHGEDKELKEACVEFEAYFLNMMFKSMRQTVDIGKSATPKSQSESIFTEMLDEEYSSTAASGKGIGLADMMYKQMKRNIKEIY